MTTANEDYKEYVAKSIREAIGSQRFGPTYIKKYLAYYKECPIEERSFYRKYVFERILEHESQLSKEKDEKVRKKLEKHLNLYKGLFEEIQKI